MLIYDNNHVIFSSKIKISFSTHMTMVGIKDAAMYVCWFRLNQHNKELNYIEIESEEKVRTQNTERYFNSKVITTTMEVIYNRFG